MKARERSDVDRYRPRLSTSGITRTIVTTGTNLRLQTKHSQMVTSHGTEHSWRESVRQSE